MDCDSSQICDICEIVKETETGTKKSPTNSNGKFPVRQSFTSQYPMPSTDHQIVSILKRLHTSMHGPERECRWYYHERRQVYWCDHIMVSSREVADIYWHQFNA